MINKYLITALFFIFGIQLLNAQDFSVSLNVAGGSDGVSYDLVFGFSPNATDGYDENFDEYAPSVPNSEFDAALLWNGERYYTQILAGDGNLSEHEFELPLTYPSDNQITIVWDNTGWDGLMSTCILQDAFEGIIINVDMLTDTSLVLTNPAFSTLKLLFTPDSPFQVEPNSISHFLYSGNIDSSQSFSITNLGEGELSFTVDIEDTEINDEINVMINAWSSNSGDVYNALQNYENNNWSIDGEGTVPMNKFYWYSGNFNEFTDYISENGIDVIIYPGNTYLNYFSQNDIVPYLTEFMENGGGVIFSGYQDNGSTWNWIDYGVWFENDLYHITDWCCGENYTNYAYTDNYYMDGEDMYLQDHPTMTGLDSSPYFYSLFMINVWSWENQGDFLPFYYNGQYGDGWTVFGKKFDNGSFVYFGDYNPDQYDETYHMFGNIVQWMGSPLNFEAVPSEGSIPTGGAQDIAIHFNGESNTEGVYEATAFVSNGAQVDSVTLHYEVSDPPDIDFMADTTSGVAPLTVSFTNLTNEGTYEIVSYLWDFGDGNTSAETDPTHTYTTNDNFSVGLTVADANGGEFTYIKEDYIQVGANISGNVSGVLTEENSPYFVTNNLILQPNDSLIIEPGVEVRFEGNYRFDIFGTFFAVGTEEDPILFTKDGETNWMSLNFANQSNDDNRLEYCIIEHGSESGYEPYFGVINCNQSNPTIAHNRISNCSADGIYLYYSNSEIADNVMDNISGDGIQSGNYSAPVITGNTLTDINSYGINLGSGADAIITGNTLTDINSYGINLGSGADAIISGNTLTDINSYGINLGSGADAIISGNSLNNTSNTSIYLGNSSNSAQILNNTIDGGNGHGINADNSTYLSIKGNEVLGKNSSGIYLDEYCDYSVIDSNRVSGMNSYGIYLYRYNDYMDITNNEITGNSSHGIYLQQYNYSFNISNNTISGNSSYGINTDNYNYGDVIQNLIINNGSYGIRLYNTQSGDCIVRNNTIHGHSNYGLYWRSDSYTNYTLDATNNSITSNQTGIYCENGYDYNTIAYNNSWNNSSSNYSGELPDGTGNLTDINANGNVCDIYYNISENPLYIDPESDNFYIDSESPNIDAGDPSLFDSDGTISDIGRYPYQYDIVPSPSSIDFGLVIVGTDSTATLTLSANLTDIEVTDIVVSDNVFSVSLTSFTILSGSSQDVEITFTPLTNAVYDGSITIMSNSQDYSEFLVPVTGTGFIPPDIVVSPNQLSATLLVGEQQSRALTISNFGTDELEWSLHILETFDIRETEWTFTNCGQTGRYGPSQEQCDDEYGEEQVNVNNGIQEWTVPFAGDYTIEVWGARGGEAEYYDDGYYGYGARMKGEFEFTENETIKILIGQKGQNAAGGGGGGGGSFVVFDDSNPLIIAGGGGGARESNYHDNVHATHSENGQNSYNGYSGGTNGNGGNGGGSGAGGGLLGDGNADFCNYDFNGHSFINGGAGGSNCDSYAGNGGFGGGGGAEWCCYGSSGGGGGYSGGAGCTSMGGGGGSYNAGTNQDNAPGVNEGHGQVVIRYIEPEWVSPSTHTGTVPGGSSEEVAFTFDATTLSPGDYSADITIVSNDPDNGEIIIPISLTVFSEETSYMFVEDQQVARNTDAAIPIRVHASGLDSIAGMVFAISILPNNNVPEIGDELGLSVVIGYGADAVMTQTGPGQASIALSGFDPPLSDDELTIAHLILPVPGETENGDTYSLSFSGVSGTTEDYELIEMEGMENVTLTVITGPPDISGLYDVYLLEGSATALGFTVDDEDGTDISVELTEAPDYVTLDFTTGDEAGTIDIAPPFGAESGYVEVAATNSEPAPETTTASFFVFVNHYPVFNPTEIIYLIEGDSAFIEVGITDVDEDTISLNLQSAPDYVTYTPSSETGGMVEIYTYAGAVSGDIVFAISDNGTPSAETTSGFTVILNHEPEIIGLGDFHVPENDVLDTLITFFDIDGDSISYQVLEAPDYTNWETVGNNEGIILTISPDDESEDGIFILRLTDPGDMSTMQAVNIFVYETFLAGDVRPHDTPNSSPVAGFTWTLDGSTAYFTNTSTDADGDSLTYSWDFGDGYTSEELSPEHTYIIDGSYTVSLTVSDDTNQDVATAEIEINNLGFSAMITAAGDGGSFDMTFGFHPDATDGYDENFDEYASSVPPPPAFDAALVWADERYYAQILAGDGDLSEHEYGIALAYPIDNTINISWNNTGWNDEMSSCQLQDAFGGVMIDVDMLSNTTLTLDNSAFTFLILKVTPLPDTMNGSAWGNFVRDYDDAGEFGDGIIAAPDVVNTLRLATQSPDTHIPDSTSNLYDAFDTNPIDEDANGDGDVYDETERGGDGFVEAADVIVTLKRATMVPEYPYIRRVDNEYPFSTRPNGNRLVSRDGPDTLYFGEAYGAPGTIAQVPVWLNHNSETPLTGLVSGFGALIEEGEYNPEEALSFESGDGINVFQVNDGNDFVSVLLTDIPEQAEGATVFLGHLEVDIPEDMETGSFITLTTRSASGSGPEYEFITVDGLTGVITAMLQSNVITFMSDWNLVSLPLEVEDASYNIVFPDAIENTFFFFDESYFPGTALTLGEGYWLRFNNAGTTTVIGIPMDELTISLNENWNLVSGLHEDLSIYSIIDPDGIIVPNTLFVFDGAYVPSETMVPGMGYWLRAFQNGEITLTSDGTARITSQDYSLKDKVNTISINGSELFFGLELSDRERLSYSLPPKPPVGAFDVRFKGDTRLAKESAEIELMSTTETITIAYDIILNAGEHHNWVLSSENLDDYVLEDAGELTVPSAERFTLELKAVVPATFTLHQNFPNPFNPITTLRYDLPEESHVTLTVYDMIGGEITKLVNTTQEAGFKSVQWDATDSMGRPVSAGVYLYQIQAGEFVQTKKMVLLK